VFSPVRALSLRPTERRKALRTINLIKEKRDGVLKGRTCVDGRPQREYIAKEDTSSPTMSLDSLTALLTIFSVENRHVAYLHAEIYEVVVVKLKNEMVIVFFVNLTSSTTPMSVWKRIREVYTCVLTKLCTAVSVQPHFELFSGTLQKLGYIIIPTTCVWPTRS